MGTFPFIIYTLLDSVSEFTVKEGEGKRVRNNMKSAKIKQKTQQKKDHYKKIKNRISAIIETGNFGKSMRQLEKHKDELGMELYQNTVPFQWDNEIVMQDNIVCVKKEKVHMARCNIAIRQVYKYLPSYSFSVL